MRQAVVLVGGKGTRLGQLARHLPKPLLPIAGSKSFLDFLLENIARHGVREILLLAGHLGDAVEARYDGERILGAQIRVFRETSPAGTAGALQLARAHLDDAFLMSNGDSILDLNYLALWERLTPEFDGAIALHEVEDVKRYAQVELDRNRIFGFREKDQTASGGGLISGGVYAIRKKILDRITALPFSLETDVFPRLASEGRLAGLPVEGYFLDIGLPETLAQARREVPDAMRRRAVFFDRDGTLNVDAGYTHEIADLKLMPGALLAVRAVNNAGGLAIVVTNQSGLARGKFTENQLAAFHAALQAELAKGGAHIDAFYHSPFHEDGVVSDFTQRDHPDRKPRAGMLRRAMLEWDIDQGSAIMLGDSDADVGAARSAGIMGEKVAANELVGAVHRALAHLPAPSSLKSVTDLLKVRAAKAREWLFDHALPMWWNAGFDRSSNTFHERLDLSGKPVFMPRRIRVQARQTFVYTIGGRLGWQGPWRDAVEAGANVLLRYGLRSDGSTRHALTSAGDAVADERRDLYDAAFVAFALASASKALAREDLATASRLCLDWVYANWSLPEGGFHEGELVPTPPRRQNPHMHLLEALLQLYEVTNQQDLLARASELVSLLETRWLSRRWGALREYFDNDWTPRPGEEGRIAEPGHQFEWAWLLDRHARMSGRPVPSAEHGIYVHGETYGVDAPTGITFDEIWVEGGTRARTSRLWPHTERMKANLARFERTQNLNAARNCIEAFDVLMSYCDVPVPGLWRDRRLADGGFVDEAAPASSFYHIALAMSELIEVAGQVE